MADVYVIKTTTSGDTSWTKTYGGAGGDFGNSVKQTPDGGYIITGSTTNFGVVSSDVYLIKTNASGDTLWTKTFGGTGEDVGSSIALTTDGGYIITGSFGETFDVYLIKTDANGNLSWSKTFGGGAADLGREVQQTMDGGFIIAGGANSFSLNSTTDFYLIKTNAGGDTTWTRIFGGTSYDRAESVQQTIDGGYIMAGIILDCANCPSDIYIVKTDAASDTLWTKRIGGMSEDLGFSIEQTTDGGYILGGWVQSFGAGNYDFYLIKTDGNGNSGCNEMNTVTTVSSPATQIATPATTVSNGCITGSPATNVGGGGTATTQCIGVGINEIENINSMQVFPNPFTNNFMVNCIIKGEVVMFDVLGKEVLRQKTTEGENIIDAQHLLPGVYLLNYFSNDKTKIHTVVKL